MNETQFEKIVRKTGRKPVECKCKECKKQCASTVCLGTPQDIKKIIDAGYGDKIKPTTWKAGRMLGVTQDDVFMFASEQTEKGCIFFVDGLCQLHDKGLKPTEGRLSHHSTKLENFKPAKSISWNVAKTWNEQGNFPLIVEMAKTLTALNEKQDEQARTDN